MANASVIYLAPNALPPPDEKAVIVCYGPPELNPLGSTENLTVFWASEMQLAVMLERLKACRVEKIYLRGPHGFGTSGTA